MSNFKTLDWLILKFVSKFCAGGLGSSSRTALSVMVFDSSNRV